MGECTAELEHRLCTAARAAAFEAYAPYSRFQVGAAVALKSGALFTGSNVENASYGLSLCAERTAIATAVSAGGLRQAGDLIAVAIACETGAGASPCGACLQWIAEFGTADAVLLLVSLDGAVTKYVLRDLLPVPFMLPGNGRGVRNRKS